MTTDFLQDVAVADQRFQLQGPIASRLAPTMDRVSPETTGQL
jgi:hypothetical protein